MRWMIYAMEQAMRSTFFRDGSMGNLDGSCYPLVTDHSDILGVLALSRLGEVVQRLRASLSWTSGGSVSMMLVHTRNNSKIARHCCGSCSNDSIYSLTKLV
jgi:hypothetical protein